MSESTHEVDVEEFVRFVGLFVGVEGRWKWFVGGVRE